VPKVTEIKSERDKVQASLEEMRRNSGAVLEYYLSRADRQAQVFERLVKNGMSEERAIELVKDVP